MNKFKKIFIILAAAISAVLVSFVIAIQNIKSNVCIAVGNPFSVVIYDHNSVGSTLFNNIDSPKNEELENKFAGYLKDITNISVYDKLINGYSLDKNIYAYSNDEIAEWSTVLKKNTLVVELRYNSMQDLVVHQDGYTRVVSYYCLAYVIPNPEKLDEIFVYYSQTNSEEDKDASYQACSPIILQGKASELYKFVKGK